MIYDDHIKRYRKLHDTITRADALVHEARIAILSNPDSTDLQIAKDRLNTAEDILKEADKEVMYGIHGH